jgi:hypothetical protein
MTRLNKALLIAQATDVADRAAFISKDPAVIKAAKQARADIARAGRSTYSLVRESRSAWERSNTR